MSELYQCPGCFKFLPLALTPEGSVTPCRKCAGQREPGKPQRVSVKAQRVIKTPRPSKLVGN